MRPRGVRSRIASSRSQIACSVMSGSEPLMAATMRHNPGVIFWGPTPPRRAAPRPSAAPARGGSSAFPGSGAPRARPSRGRRVGDPAFPRGVDPASPGVGQAVALGHGGLLLATKGLSPPSGRFAISCGGLTSIHPHRVLHLTVERGPFPTTTGCANLFSARRKRMRNAAACFGAIWTGGARCQCEEIRTAVNDFE